MAKRPRMGRNLDALLGGAKRERTSNSTQASTTASSDAEDIPAASSASAAEISDAVDKQAAPNEATPTSAVGESSVSQTVATADMFKEGAAEAIVADQEKGISAIAAGDDTAGPDRFRMVGVDQIRRGSYQPRRLFDQELLQELADSIKAEGLIQPIIVRPDAGAFELVAGERRWRAAQLAGMADIPAIIREMPDKSVAAVSLIENIQRKDLNPLEEAAAFERLCDEFGMTHKAVAESVGRSRASVTNLMRLLELHDEVKVLVDKGELEMGHARAILGAPKDHQHALAKDVLKRGLTVRAVEKTVRDMTANEGKEPVRKPSVMTDPDIERLSQKLSEKLGATVRIQHKATGKGKLEINYASVAELQGILAHIK